MYRNILVYGAIAGAIAIGAMTVNVSNGIHSLLVGYLVLFVALSLIFVGIKRYRYVELGGVIRFGTASAIGLGIAVVASIVYVICWELYLWSTDFSFFEHFNAAQIEEKRAAGASAAEIAQASRELAEIADSYNNNLLLRIGFTLAEVLPVGLVVTLISAALLRNSNFLPARGGDKAGL